MGRRLFSRSTVRFFVSMRWNLMSGMFGIDRIPQDFILGYDMTPFQGFWMCLILTIQTVLKGRHIITVGAARWITSDTRMPPTA
jgi:hypothetical protein